MERKGPIRPKQGGGTGVGFKMPPKIYLDEPRKFPLILSDIKRFLEHAKSQAELLLIESTECQRRAVQNKLDHLNVVEESLQWRMFVLSQRKNSDLNWNTTAISSCTRIQNMSRTQLLKTSMHQRRDMVLSTESFYNVQGASHVMKTIDKRISSPSPNAAVCALRMPITQFIPGLPKQIEEVVQLWRGGDKKRFYPVYLFDTVLQRKKLIHGYTDCRWRESGQKSAYYKFKKLVTIVSEAHGDLPIFDVNNRNWNEAFLLFHAKHDREKPLPLSAFFMKKLYQGSHSK
ncbi:hypothetical protein FGB62_241g05 [Gracilaria domingensis]|nr:hypothetical protein FGB62_241g05 [Gracilaria domingensis]